jgi:hypothetical protein
MTSLATFMTALAAILTTFATIAIAYLTWNYVDYSERQWQTMQQQLVLSQRPWVSAGIDLSGPLFVENNSPAIKLKITLKNTGQSPATSIIPVPIMVGREKQPMDVLEIQKRQCSTIYRPTGPGGGTGYTLFPGDSVIEYNTTSMAREEIESIGLDIAPFIIICINYNFTFRGESHQTASFYSLVRVDPAYPGQAFVLDIRTSHIPVASLQLIPLGSYAD